LKASRIGARTKSNTWPHERDKLEISENRKERPTKERTETEAAPAPQELPYRFVKPVRGDVRVQAPPSKKVEPNFPEDFGKEYKLKAPIQRDGLTEEMLERINSTEVTVRLGDLFGMSKDLREGEKLRLTRIQHPVKDTPRDAKIVNIEQQEMMELTEQDSQLKGDALELGELPEIEGVFVTTVKTEGIPTGSVISQDLYLQYLEGLSDGEKPKQIYVACDSVPLRVTFPYINSQGPVECVLDSGSQIVSTPQATLI
jgi:hypothetical protein